MPQRTVDIPPAFKRKKTVALIGAGQMTLDNHLPVLKHLGIDPLWIFDTNPISAKKIHRYFGGQIVECDTRIEKLIEPDFILVSCPFGAREPYYEQFQDHWSQSAIFIEKPIALTVKQHDRISGLRPAYGLASGFSKRPQANVSWARNLTKLEMFGKLRGTRIELGGLGIKTGGGFASNFELAGGGMLFEVAVHCIDAVNYITGATDTSVESCRMEFEGPFEIHTDTNYRLTTLHGDLDCTLLVTVMRRCQNVIRLIFDNAILEFSLFADGMRVIGNDNETRFEIAMPKEKSLPRNGISSIFQFWSDFIAGVNNKEPNYTSLEDCRLATKLIEAIYRAGGRSL